MSLIPITVMQMIQIPSSLTGDLLRQQQCNILMKYYKGQTLSERKVKLEKSFAVHWIAFKCKENLCRSCFICIEGKPVLKRFIRKTSVFCRKYTKTMKLSPTQLLSFTVSSQDMNTAVCGMYM